MNKNNNILNLAWPRRNSQQVVGYCLGTTYYFWLLDSAKATSKVIDGISWNLKSSDDFTTLTQQLKTWLKNCTTDNLSLTIPSDLATITSQTIPNEWSLLARRQFLNMKDATYTAPIICKHLFTSSPAADASTILLQAVVKQQTLDQLTSSLADWKLKNLTLAPFALARGIAALKFNKTCTCGLIFLTERSILSLVLTKKQQLTWETIEINSPEELKPALQNAITNLEPKVSILLLDGDHPDLTSLAADLTTNLPLTLIPDWLKEQHLVSETLPKVPSLMAWGLAVKAKTPFLNFAPSSSKRLLKTVLVYLCSAAAALGVLGTQSYLIKRHQKQLCAEETELARTVNALAQSQNYPQLAKATELLKKFNLPAVYVVKIKIANDLLEILLLSPSKKRLERLMNGSKDQATCEISELIPEELYGLSVKASLK